MFARFRLVQKRIDTVSGVLRENLAGIRSVQMCLPANLWFELSGHIRAMIDTQPITLAVALVSSWWGSRRRRC